MNYALLLSSISQNEIEILARSNEKIFEIITNNHRPAVTKDQIIANAERVRESFHGNKLLSRKK